VGLSDSIRERGWRQGRLLDGAIARSLLANDDDLDDFDDFVIISHSCDVVSDDFEKEPTVELIGRRRIDSADGNYAFAKSPRLWHMSAGADMYELRMSSRREIPRQHLAEHDPIGSITEADLRILKRWMANRYARAGFADEFNRRCRPALARVAGRLKRDGHMMSAIYVLVDDSELPEEKDYEIVVIATMLEEDYDVAEHRSTCQESLNQIVLHLDGCDGILVTDAELRSEAAVSLADLRELSRWDFDSLSLRDEAAELPVQAND
jgi:hypothetical protein